MTGRPAAGSPTVPIDARLRARRQVQPAPERPGHAPPAPGSAAQPTRKEPPDADDHTPARRAPRRGGERRTARPAQPAVAAIKARQPDPCADPAAHQRDDDDLDAYIKEMIATAPPLTSEQRDKLALLLHRHHRTR
jgi:hypothetical protein